MTELSLTAQKIRAAVADLPDDYVVDRVLLERLLDKTPAERKAVEIAHRHLEDLGARLPSGVAIPMGAVSPIRSTIEAAVEEALRKGRV